MKEVTIELSLKGLLDCSGQRWGQLGKDFKILEIERDSICGAPILKMGFLGQQHQRYLGTCEAPH